MIQTITTKKPKQVPMGYRKFKYCTGGYKPSILGKEIEHDQPIWAEVRYDKNALFADDRKYYRLYTFTKV